MSALHHYMNAVGPVNVIVRVPYPMPRWRSILKAMTPVMHSYGRRQKDMYALEGLLPYPDERDAWSNGDEQFAERLARAYDGDPLYLPKFDLYDWQRGRFVLVRRAVS